MMMLIPVKPVTLNSLLTLRRDSLIHGELVINDLLDELINNCFVETNPAFIVEQTQDILVIMTYINTIYTVKKIHNRIDFESIKTMATILDSILKKRKYALQSQ